MFEFSGTVLFITPERLPYIEYLSETLSAHMAFVFRAPPLSHVSNIFILPFDTMLWICVLCFIILSTTIIGIIYFLTKEKYETFNKSDLMMLAICTICQMGVHLVPRTLSAKIATVNILKVQIIIQ